MIMQAVLTLVDPLQDGFTHLQVLLFLGDLSFKIVRQSLPQKQSMLQLVKHAKKLFGLLV